jgi:hypothetical protein
MLEFNESDPVTWNMYVPAEVAGVLEPLDPELEPPLPPLPPHPIAPAAAKIQASIIITLQRR